MEIELDYNEERKIASSLSDEELMNKYCGGALSFAEYHEYCDRIAEKDAEKGIRVSFIPYESYLAEYKELLSQPHTSVTCEGPIIKLPDELIKTEPPKKKNFWTKLLKKKETGSGVCTPRRVNSF